MPRLGNKHFAYTKKGREDWEKAVANKKKKKAVKKKKKKVVKKKKK